jgi:uncharacterized membrane protein
MLARSRWWEFLQLGVIAAMFITAIVRWSSVPGQIPIHWNISGEVDGYGGKFSGLLLLPLITLGIYALLAVIPRFDPARANYPSFRGPYTTIRVGFVVYMALIYLFMQISIGREETLRVDRLISASIAVLFVLIGLVLGKIRPNYFVGIRTPWTLTSKQCWVKTHSAGGWVFLATGAASAIGAIIGGQWALIFMFAALVPGIVFLFVYSYLIWRSDPDRIPAQDTTPGPEHPGNTDE